MYKSWLVDILITKVQYYIESDHDSCTPKQYVKKLHTIISCKQKEWRFIRDIELIAAVIWLTIGLQALDKLRHSPHLDLRYAFSLRWPATRPD